MQLLRPSDYENKQSCKGLSRSQFQFLLLGSAAMSAAKWLVLVNLLQIPAAVHATPFGQHELVSRDVGIGQLPIPSTYDAPRFRWWWPGGWIEPDVVESEIQSIASAGFGGGEIGDVEDSIKVSMDPKIYGWARDRWNAGVLAAYKSAQK